MRIEVIIVLVSTILLNIPTHCQAQTGHEWAFNLKNGVLFNRSSLKTLQGNSGYTEVKNTLQQSIGGNYTRVTKGGLLLSAGIDAGYEQYVTKINYPFEQLGYNRPASISDKYSREITVPFLQLNLNLGYRRVISKMISIEARIGQIIHLPLTSVRFDDWLYEKSRLGWSMNNVNSYGYYGKYAEGFGFEPINYIYLGSSIKSRIKRIKSYNIGVQYQRQYIFANNPFNSHRITYYDGAGFTRAVDEFKGKHATLSLVLGLPF